MGIVEAICISRKRGTVKKEVTHAFLKRGVGIVGDAHAGNWHRQVSLLQRESIDRMKKIIPNLVKGAFAENIITAGVNYSKITVGSHLKLGKDIILEVTQIGKECHTACAIRSLMGDCIMPREGLFCKVIEGGTLVPGDEVSVMNINRLGYRNHTINEMWKV